MSRRRSKSEIVDHLIAGTSGLRGRVNAHCVTCVYDDLEPGTWRQQVAQCSVSSCPIWEVRAKSKSTVDIGGTTSEAYVLDQVSEGKAPISSGSHHTAKKIEHSDLIEPVS